MGPASDGSLKRVAGSSEVGLAGATAWPVTSLIRLSGMLVPWWVRARLERMTGQVTLPPGAPLPGGLLAAAVSASCKAPEAHA